MLRFVLAFLGSIVLSASTFAAGIPALRYHELQVAVPGHQDAYVQEITPRLVPRLTYREVVRPKICTFETFVPVDTIEKQHRTVYREILRTTLVTRDVFVEEFQPKIVMRKIYREVVRKEPREELAYVERRSVETRSRLVYVEVPVHVTSQECFVRLDAHQHPVFEMRPVTKRIKKYVLREERVNVPVSHYRLERCTKLHLVRAYVPQWEQVEIRQSTYRLEQRSQLVTVRDYVPTVEEQFVPCRRYRLEQRTEVRNVKEYVPTWEQAVVPTTSYRLKRQPTVEKRKLYVPCPNCLGASGHAGSGFVATLRGAGSAPEATPGAKNRE